MAQEYVAAYQRYCWPVHSLTDLKFAPFHLLASEGSGHSDIYGPEYTSPEHLERLRARRLSANRSLALQAFALGIEALERFVRQEPFYRVHECVFGVLALESEPINPRL